MDEVRVIMLDYQRSEIQKATDNIADLKVRVETLNAKIAKTVLADEKRRQRVELNHVENEIERERYSFLYYICFYLFPIFKRMKLYYFYYFLLICGIENFWHQHMPV